MMLDDSQLERMLTDADARHVPGAPVDLARRVCQRARRRQTVRRVIAAGVVVILAGSALLVRLMPSGSPTEVVSDPKPVPLPPVDTGKLRQEYAQLMREADAHEQAAKSLIAAEGSVKPVSLVRAVGSDPLLDVLAQRDRGARALLRFGDAVAADNRSRAIAESAYRQAVSLSPKSDVAAEAKKRLAEIGA